MIPAWVWLVLVVVAGVVSVGVFSVTRSIAAVVLVLGFWALVLFAVFVVSRVVLR